MRIEKKLKFTNDSILKQHVCDKWVDHQTIPATLRRLCESAINYMYIDQWGLCEYVITLTILGGSPVILWISKGGKPKWLPLKFGYHDVMRTSPIAYYTSEPM